LKPEEWFKAFIKEYRDIVDKIYSKKKDLFPLSQPLEVNVYLVDDEKRIFPEVVVFFLRIGEDSEEFLKEDVFVFREKIRWPDNFEEQEPEEQEMTIWAIDQDTFLPQKLPVGYMEETYTMRQLQNDPTAEARIKVQEHLLSGFRGKLTEANLRIAELRKKVTGNSEISQFMSNLKDLKNITADEDRAGIISQAFWLLGFETMNLEKMKGLQEYKELHNISHVDVLAFLLPDRFAVAIEEGKITKERLYKQATLQPVFKILKIKREEWKIFFLWIGKERRSVVHLEGLAKILSYEDFYTIINQFISGRGWMPNLQALRALFGYKTKLFNIP